MKYMKRIASVVLAMVMVLAMSMPVMAAGKYSITIETNVEGHTYEAYQIFKGSVKPGTGTMGDIKWGAGITEAGQTALGDAAELAKCLVEGAENYMSPDAFAEKVKPYLTTIPTKESSTLTDVGYVISGLEEGYYLVQDKENSLDGAESDAYTSYIMRVVNDVTVNPKSEVPTVDKQVKDDAGDGENPDGWGETADHEIGETFQFKLKATLPTDINFNAYNSYMLKFTDTMSAGITFEQINSVIIYKADGTTVVKELKNTEYVETANEDAVNASWTLTIDDLVSLLPEGSSLGDGYVVEVVYSAHLNENATIGTGKPKDNVNTVDLDYSNNPNGEGTGSTPEDSVYVFTFDIPGMKYAGTPEERKPLAGAQFKLQNSKGKWAVLKEGKVGSWTAEEKDGTPVTSNADGVFSFSGVDNGVYTLVETVTPPGYNTCDPIKVTITGTHSEDNGVPSVKRTMKVDDDDTEVATIDVYNQEGTTLPETGGIGTTIFYVVGAALVIGAGVLLVVKKRMSKEQ